LHLLHVLPVAVPLIEPDPISVAPVAVPVTPPGYDAEAEPQSLEALDHLLNPSWGRPPSVEKKVCWGNPVEQIVDYAAEHEIDLIVIATHGRTGLSHIFLGSVAEQIVREAPCPVLTIRERENPGEND